MFVWRYQQEFFMFVLLFDIHVWYIQTWPAASLVTVCRSLASYNVQCTMYVPVFHLMLTIDMSLLANLNRAH